MKEVLRFVTMVNRPATGALNAAGLRLRDELGINPTPERVVGIAHKYHFDFTEDEYLQLLADPPSGITFPWLAHH